MEGMAVPTARLKTYIEGHLDFHASQRWPQLEEVTISWRGSYGYVSAYLTEDEAIPVCRLRYLGSDTGWGFALYQASSERYDDTLLPDGSAAFATGWSVSPRSRMAKPIRIGGCGRCTDCGELRVRPSWWRRRSTS